MKLSLSDGRLIALRAIAVGGFVGAFLLALLLSAAPQLHEHIHASSDVTHQCAVTLLAGGTYEHAPINTIAIAPQSPKATAALVYHQSQLASPRLEFSLLEHAPPATS